MTSSTGPCQTVVCADCLAQYLVKNGCLQCPCKGCCTKLTAESLKSAPSIYVNLLEDVALHCPSCNVDIRAGLYQSHKCNASSPTSHELLPLLAPPALAAQSPISCSPPINGETCQGQVSPARIIFQSRAWCHYGSNWRKGMHVYDMIFVTRQ